MKLSLRELKRVVADVARDSSPSTTVLSASNGEGASDYAEVTMASQGERFVVGLSRLAGEQEIRQVVHEHLRNRTAAGRHQ